MSMTSEHDLPQGYLQNVDLDFRDAGVFKDFVKLVCVQATEGALFLGIVRQKLLHGR